MASSADILAKLHRHGIRLTMPRRMVLEVLCRHHDHLPIPQIQAFLQERGVPLSETTIYRVLQWLNDLGVVSQTDLGQGCIVYQIIGDAPHHHLVCLRCGALVDVDNSLFAPVIERLRAEYGFEPRIDHMAIFGLCRACRPTPD